MSRRALSVAVLLSCIFSAACASKANSRFGTRILDCVVVEREHDAPGTGGASYAGTGNYYLVFETKEVAATARYRFQVTRQQWFRFPEGSRVRISLNNNVLMDIRPSD
ncbi:MAG TPA: hypothetical protein VGL03_14910 [Thermoanaerobaculia bacterium]|jgi:hypothetical protein